MGDCDGSPIQLEPEPDRRYCITDARNLNVDATGAKGVLEAFL